MGLFENKLEFLKPPIFTMYLFNDVSNLKTHLDYYEDLTLNCEILNFLFSHPNRTVLLTFLVFLSIMFFDAKGQENSNVYNFLLDFHNDLSTFFKS